MGKNVTLAELEQMMKDYGQSPLKYDRQMWTPRQQEYPPNIRNEEEWLALSNALKVIGSHRTLITAARELREECEKMRAELDRLRDAGVI